MCTEAASSNGIRPRRSLWRAPPACTRRAWTAPPWNTIVRIRCCPIWWSAAKILRRNCWPRCAGSGRRNPGPSQLHDRDRPSPMDQPAGYRPPHTYRVSHLDALEAESVFVMREVVAEFERPVLLFSGGKDSIVMLRLAEKAFWPARIPFPVMHVDTGHNFPEVIEFRDRRVAELTLRLVVASVQESIDKGRVVE